MKIELPKIAPFRVTCDPDHDCREGWHLEVAKTTIDLRLACQWDDYPSYLKDKSQAEDAGSMLLLFNGKVDLLRVSARAGPVMGILSCLLAGTVESGEIG